MVLTNTKVFIRGFDFGTSLEQIQAHCAAAGTVTAVEIQGKGAAVVTYSNAGGARKAIEMLNQSTIFGNSRFIDVKEDAQSRPGPPAANGVAVTRKVLAPAFAAANALGCRVFIRGFDFGTSESQIQVHCAEAGKVTAVEMQGKGAAVVTYSTAGGARKAIELLNQSTISGNSRFIDVKQDAQSWPGAPLAANGVAVTRKRPAPASGAADAPGCRVFIRGFDFGTTDEFFEGHMSQVGTIEHIQWCNKGSAIVTYSSHEEAQAAVAHLNGTTIEGNSRYIDVVLKEDEGEPQYKAAAVKTEQREALPNGRGKGRGKGAKDPAGSGRVFVRGFDFGTTDEQLEAHMGTAGEIFKIFWVSKGSAVVVYKTQGEAEAAAEALNQTVIPDNTRYIDVVLTEAE